MVLFNHESPRRGNFCYSKNSSSNARLNLINKSSYLGNLYAKEMGTQRLCRGDVAYAKKSPKICNCQESRQQ